MNLPNRLTLFRIFLIPVFVLLMEWPVSAPAGTLPLTHLIACLVFVVASVTDYLDGYIARRDQLVTNFGKFWDPLADKMLVLTALIELSAQQIVPGWAVAIIVIRDLAVTGLRLLLVQDGEVMAAAWPGKVKTFTQMLAIIFLLVQDGPFAGLPFSIGQVFFYVAVIFTIYSWASYFWNNRQAFSDFS
ncbi:MAG: CDP-diacylglycerol--glycerol-3-phosphate 3-phosphatidyltransferase [Aerococcus sp.]|nr:CDP-diacylglycerol--glycerol-3-phosphate 3-phosphatidyltransferase [Aerococcus sp.]